MSRRPVLDLAQFYTWLVMGLCMQLVRGKNYKSIEHRFLIPGHTHLPSDRDFALMEKHKKYINQVYSPEEWYDIVRKSNRKSPFEVIVMQQDWFFSFEEISLPKKTVTIDKQPLNFKEVRFFKFESAHPNTIFVKYTLNGVFEPVNIGKRGTRLVNQISPNHLKTKYNELIKLNEKKNNDLNKLLKYIPPIRQKLFTDIIGDRTLVTEETIDAVQEDDIENIDGDVTADIVIENGLDIW
ncbi:hypothetical protein MML48_2g00008994 [Holotrichia oblita]|uniref:Uncharacterized protein n=1 Tax=Holotrichia oblita TaxID=644536 RepID=A0ACB9TMG6_HOLOL|nr:hypothetical protein MML48_2g00008994 [Holotrichia oblita]